MSQRNPTSQSEWEDPPEDCPIGAGIEKDQCTTCLSGPEKCELYDPYGYVDEDGEGQFCCLSYDEYEGEGGES